MKKGLVIGLMAMLAATLSCGREEEQKPEVKVEKESQDIIVSGINLEAAEDAGSPEIGQDQTVVFRFTATDRWSATVEATKASSWITLEPSSGPAGDVNMSVIVQDNTDSEERSAVVTIKSGDEKVRFTVTQAGALPKEIEVTGIALDRTSVTLEEGQTTTLTATVNPSDATDKSVSWSSSDATVASVDQSGKVTAHKAGSTEITAKAGGKSAKCTVTVSKKIVSVASITLNKTSLTLEIGKVETLTATILPDNATNKTVTWTSNDESVAIVSSSGVVTAIAPGTATITATTVDGGKTAICRVTVQQPTFNAGDIEGTEDDTWN